MTSLHTQNLILSSGKLDHEKAYWQSKLDSQMSLSTFPPAYTRTTLADSRVETVSHTFSDPVYQAMMKLANGSPAAAFMVAVSGVAALLSIYNETEDIVVGMPVFQQANQTNALNRWLALRNEVRLQDDTFKDLLIRVKETISEASKHANYPYERLMQHIGLSVGDGVMPLCNTIVLLEQLHGTDGIADLKADMVFSFSLHNGQFRLELLYNAALYLTETVKRIAGHLENFLSAALSSMAAPLASLPYLSEQEQQLLLYAYNESDTEYPKDKSLPQWFEEQVEKTPDRIAVIFEEKQLTYRELNEKANQLAWHLLEQGVQRNQVIGLMVERSLELVIAVWGILKSGAAYLPIDPEYPEARIHYMLEHSQTSMLITQAKFAGNVAHLDAKTLLIEQTLEEIATPTANPNVPYDPDQLMYLLYTSGSTGNPKGAMIKCHSFVNLLTWYIHEFGMHEEDCVLLMAPISFDTAQKNLFCTLLVGGRLAVYSPGLYDYHQMSDLIERDKVTIVNCTPNAFYPFVDFNKDTDFKRLTGLKRVFLGGEPIALSRCKSWLLSTNCHGQIVNTYGPTECTDLCSYYRIDNHTVSDVQVVPIGKPLYNAKLYVLDKHLRLLPDGMIGELYIGGVGVSKGYFRAEEMTGERFLSTPHLPSTVVYKTGDLVRWLPDGNMEFVGRVDHQVKIRGYRIELGEIESKLLTHEEIQDVLVTDRTDVTGKYLCAYVKGAAVVTAEALKQHLARQLPDFMVPSHFVFLDKFPLTPSGKMDRKALPDPKKTVEEKNFCAPTHPIEEQLVEIWRAVLGYERISIDSEFSELGGHSLQAIDVVARIYQQFRINVTLRDIYTLQTVQKIARYMQESTVEQDAHQIVPAGEQDHYPASSAQKRMYVMQQMEEGAHATYNITQAMVLTGNLNKARFLQALDRLVARHEALRTSFDMIDGQLVQRIHHDVQPDVSFEVASDEQMQDIVQAFVRPFDLQSPSLFRVGLIRVQPDQHVLIFDIHHIVADGVSLRILLEDFMDLYQEKELAPVPLQYKDFSEWQHQFYSTEAFDEQGQFWLDLFSDEVPILELPKDEARPAVYQFEGAHLMFAADPELTRSIRRFVAEQGTTLNMVLLAAYSVFLARHSNEEDVVVGLPILGKQHPDLDRTVGMFVNTLAIRSRPVHSRSFSDFLEDVKQQTLQCFANQEFPFELLIEKLNLKRDNSRHPLIQTMLVVQNIDMPAFSLDSISAEPLNVFSNTSKFDLSLVVEEGQEDLAFTFEYATALFCEETIEKFAQRFLLLLQSIMANPQTAIRSLELVTPQEKQLLLNEFNRSEQTLPNDLTVVQLFEAIAARQPDHVAVISGDERITYRELNEKANQLAHHLSQKGVGPDRFVGLLTERSLDMIVGIFGVLKAGGAYVPIDPDYPQERMAYMLENSQAKWLLTQTHLLNRVPFSGDTVRLDNDPCFANVERSNPPLVNAPHDLAYLIYTSGTTGRPKGVMIEHKSWVNCQACCTELFGITPQDRASQFFSQSFDASVLDITTSLLIGGTMVIVPKEAVRDSAAFTELMNREQVTVSILTPAYAAHFEPAQLPHLRLLITGGSPATAELVRKWNEHLTYINAYGPTEATICSTYARFSKGEVAPQIIPIGGPLFNTQLYVLGDGLQLQPIGVKGELCIAGAGVARGYYNQPEMTEEQFVDNPFVEGTKMYRTGDWVRWLPDGTIEYIGRIDHQVKIRGYRIELGEVETCLLSHPAVRQAHVMTHQQEVDLSLCAYITADQTLDLDDLRMHMGQTLPPFMIPTYFVQVDAISLTANGKVDQKRLPPPQSQQDATCYQAPTTEIEARLVEIWQSELGVETVGILDHFFDLGGHSIKAIAVLAGIKRCFGHQLPFSSLTRGGTIQHIAKLLEACIAQTVEQGQATRSLLVPLHPAEQQTQRAPIFLIHPVGGSVLCYRALAAALGPSQPVYGLVAQGLADDMPPLDRIEEMAALYMEHIRRVQPGGPYTLGGWSLGGTVAFAIAEQLKRQGEEVASLLLFDSYAPVAENKLQTGLESELIENFLYDLAGSFGWNIGELGFECGEISSEADLLRLTDWARDRELLPAEWSGEQMIRLYRVYKANVEALHHYEAPMGSDQPITLIVAGDQKEMRGWEQILRVAPQTFYVEADHYSLLAEPCVREVASIIAGSIERN